MLPVREFMRALPSGAPVSAITDDFGGRLFHMNSPSKPMALPKFTPPPTWKFPLVFVILPVVFLGKVTPPPMLKLYFGASSWATLHTQKRTKRKNCAAKYLFITYISSLNVFRSSVVQNPSLA